MVLKILWHANQEYMESLKCGSGEGWRRLVGPIV